jgi:hypothetical protein
MAEKTESKQWPDSGSQVPQRQVLEQGQLAVEEMTATWHDQHRQRPGDGPSPSPTTAGRYRPLAMNDQRAAMEFRRNGFDLKPAGRGTDQQHALDGPLRVQAHHGMAGDKGTERKPRQAQGPLRRLGRHDGQQVFQLTPPSS